MSVISAVRPDLASQPMRLLTDGWDCLAVEVADTLFKLPKHAAAAERLRREPAFLNLVRPLTDLALPHMRLHTRPVLLSEHVKIAGEAVDGARYETLGEAERGRLADDLARFFAAIHDLDPELVRRLDCDAVRPWAAAGEILTPIATAVRHGVVDQEVLEHAAARLAAHEGYGPDEIVSGQFDTHGWNMAFDPSTRRLAGLFDFAGAGIGALHRDLSYPTFVSPDLTRRITAQYTVMTGRRVDIRRVFDAHGALRVIELSDALRYGDDPTQFVDALRSHIAWSHG